MKAARVERLMNQRIVKIMAKIVNIGDRAYSRLGRMAEVVKVTPKRATWKIADGWETEVSRDKAVFAEKQCTWDDFVVPQTDVEAAYMAAQYARKLRIKEVDRRLKSFSPANLTDEQLGKLLELIS